MYFSSYNHDEDDILYNEINKEDDTCLICWETSTTNNNVSKMQSLVVTSCSCNGPFHYNCLSKWTNKTKTCPICHVIINQSIHRNNKLRLFQNINNISLKLLKYISLLWFMNMIYNIMVNIQYTIEKIHDDGNITI